MDDPRKPNWLLRLPPPVWLLILLGAAALADYMFEARPIAVLHAPAVGVLLGLTGIALAAWGRITFAVAGTEIMPTSASNTALVTRGPFRFTRNPMYLGLVLLALGVALYFATVHFLAVPVLLLLLCNFVFIPFEEAKMQRQFESSFGAYRQRVRRWL
jgi:protein-S-isoprenylcysteine O-methyltransferase Ste14